MVPGTGRFRIVCGMLWAIDTFGKIADPKKKKAVTPHKRRLGRENFLVRENIFIAYIGLRPFMIDGKSIYNHLI